ncbi:MAG: hypothetical protein JSS83_25965 [Cyanobacteria bacterium SZAS LIN-3]|nr:hypothetical protein [Cyanobacteria bacterium SZAS LIN-3]
MVEVKQGATIVRQDDKNIYIKRICQYCGFMDDVEISVSIPAVGKDFTQVYVCRMCKRMQQVRISG